LSGGAALSELSPHIPDLDLITYYGENNSSVFSKVSPWTKAFMLVLIILFITISRNLALLALLYGTTLAVYWLSGLPIKKLFQWYLLPALFVFSLILLLVWETEGAPILTLGVAGFSLTLTDEGLRLALTLLLKALISVTYTLFFLMTTKYNHFSALIYKACPYPVDQIFLMSYRFIFITLRMVDSMLKALRSRGGGLIKSTLRQGRMFAEIFALTLIRSYDRADRISKAMEARGFSGMYVAATRIPAIRPLEYAFMLASVGLAAYLMLYVK
jgi:cobalt/nickel transport system permease protein